jgi:uncharacterized protein (DUF488 family)
VANAHAVQLATIGVYGFSADSFLATLVAADVAVVVDVRARRGVRGAEYAWANSRRLQDALAAAGIEYRHLPALAPAAERGRVARRARAELSAEFRDRYAREVLDGADLRPVLAAAAGGRAALLCVEREPAACHRSLLAARLEREHGAQVVHLLPPAA